MTSITDLRTAPPDVLAAVPALNAQDAEATGPLDAPALDRLIAAARHAAAVEEAGGVAAFLLGFGPGAAHASPNYRWFDARLRSFACIDRVVAARRARGRGLARALYRDFSTSCPDLGPLVCEVNLDPPNPVSDAFHAAPGFAGIGRGSPAAGKTVRDLFRRLRRSRPGQTLPGPGRGPGAAAAAPGLWMGPPGGRDDVAVPRWRGSD